MFNIWKLHVHKETTLSLVRDAEGHGLALFELTGARLLCIEMVDSCMAREHFAGLGDLQALRVGFVGFHCHNFIVISH
jgi:hypothetical protein